MPFTPYIARDRHYRDFRFDFHIANETGQSWYDGSPNQWMMEREWCLDQLRPGMTVVDCGAHHGMMSVLFAHAVGAQGVVHAYEALPSNADVIELNAALNRMPQIHAHPVGVGDRNASFRIEHNASNTVVMGDAGGAGTPASELVSIVRLDDHLPAATRVDFIKIDVEGHDLQALRGMSRVLAQRPIIDLELHNFLFADRRTTLAEILAILHPLGYDWSLLGDIGGNIEHVGATLDLDRIATFDNPHLFGLPQAK